MNNKKLQEFISTLQTMAKELDETSPAETLNEPAEQFLPEQTEQTAENAQPVTAEASATPYATTAYNPADELHCYKTYELPDNITVKADILKKSTAVTFDIFNGEKTISGSKLMLVYNPKNLTSVFGSIFRLNLYESMIDRTYINELGDRYNLNGNYVAGMLYTTVIPGFAHKILNSIGKSDIKNNDYRWMTNGTVAKYYNLLGDLIFACTIDKNYVLITYDSNRKITSLREGNSNVSEGYTEYSFTYTSNYVSTIKNVRTGKTVSLNYNGSYLKTITYSDGRKLTLSYSRSALNVTSSDKYEHDITMNGTASLSITSKSSVFAVPGNTPATNSNMLSWQVTYGSPVKIQDKDGNCEYYIFSDDEMTSDYYIESNSKVAYAEKRKITYYPATSNTRVETFIAPDDKLNNTPYSQFYYIESYNHENTSCTYDKYYKPTYETHKRKLLAKDSYIDISKTNTYNSNGLLTREDINYYLYVIDDGDICDKKDFNQIVTYEYDTENRPIKRTSYYTDRLSTHGKDVVEYAYKTVDNKYKTTVVSYNTLAPTKVLVNETTSDKWGNVIEQTDPTGLKKITYGWNSNSDRLENVTLPDGSKIEYGYHTDGKLAKVTANVTADGTKDGENTNEISYEKGEVTELISPHNTLGFSYDGQRRISEISLDGVGLYKFSYSMNGAEPIELTLTNAKKENFVCKQDKAQTYTQIEYGDNTEFRTDYGNNKLPKTETDSVTGETVTYSYDKADNLEYYTLTENGTTTYSAYLSYDQNGTLLRASQGGKTSIGYSYIFDEGFDGKLIKIEAGNAAFKFSYDELGRYTGRTVSYGENRGYNAIHSESITYKQELSSVETSSGTRSLYKQSNLPYKLTYTNGSSIVYSYDVNGNITEISQSGFHTTYTYDKLNRLVSENNPALRNTYYYTYDNNGNILSRKVVSSLDGETYIDSYTYTNGKLTNDGRGNSIVYDAVGNPTKYRGYSLTWEKGKRLTKFGNTTFAYDGRGRRIKKNGVRYYYDYADRLIAGSDGTEYFYDIIGVAGIKYNGVWYVYKRDAQNNVIAILDNTGKTVVEYTYNAWGYHTVSGSLASSLGAVNPFRYRSYFYDTETQLYFLKTRYYDPLIGRFLNMDSISYADPETINGLNLYAYCYNNPVNFVDISGNIPIANYFYKDYFETLVLGFNNKWLGRIDYSITTLEHQSEDTGIFYAYTAKNSNGGVLSYGTGINLWGWLGNDINFSLDGNLNLSANATPWFHLGVSLGLNGISFSAGITINDSSHDFTFGLGAIPLMLISGITSLVDSGASLVTSFIKWIVGLIA